MGLTLIAILTAALLLPGIIAARTFFEAGKTSEVEPAIPALSSVNGISLIGGFSVVSHLIYVLALSIVVALPPWTGLPPADPYALFVDGAGNHDSLGAGWSLFLGLAWLTIIAAIVGFLAGKLVVRHGDPALFYGPLAEVIIDGRGSERFINAYVLTKIAKDGRFVGYRGTVTSLLRDEYRFPSRVVLKNVATFYLDIAGDEPVRREHAETIDWIALSSDEWFNIAFRVFEVVDREAFEQIVDTDEPDADGEGVTG